MKIKKAAHEYGLKFSTSKAIILNFLQRRENWEEAKT